MTLFTRPRRFGKTLALSMLRTFFELEYDRDGNPVDKSRYFEGKKIMEAPEKVISMMGKYPVIKLSLKSAKQPDFRTAFIKLRDEIIGEFRRHSYIWKSDMLLKSEQEELISLEKASNDENLCNLENLNLQYGGNIVRTGLKGNMYTGMMDML